MMVCTLVVQFVNALPSKCNRILFAAAHIKFAGFIYWCRSTIVNSIAGSCISLECYQSSCRRSKVCTAQYPYHDSKLSNIKKTRTIFQAKRVLRYIST